MQPARPRHRAAGDPVRARGPAARAGLRHRRRLRRLPRGEPAVGPGRRAGGRTSGSTRTPGWASSPRRRRRREELIYAYHERGFALHSMRSPADHPAVPPGASRTRTSRSWPDERIWTELRARLARRDGFDAGRRADPGEGRSPRCAASSPSRCATAGCSWPGTPRTSCRPPAPRGSTWRSPTWRCWPRRIAGWYATGDESGLDAYRRRCLRRVWRVQHFSWWMTSMLHRPRTTATRSPSGSSSRSCGTLTSSRAAATSFAENYVGLPLP